MIYQCRICLEESSDVKEFIAPCLCNGTNKYVHRHCLDEWRSQDPGGKNFLECNTCKFKYEIIISPENKKLEAKRQKEYQKCVALSCMSMIFYTVCFVLILTGIVFLIEVCGLVRVYDRASKYIPGPPMFVYAVTGVVCLFSFFGILGLVIFLGGYLSGFGGGNLFMAAANINFFVLIVLGTIIGFVSAVYMVYCYLDEAKKKHRQRIWYRQESKIKIVKDFGINGPPRRAVVVD